MKKNIGINVLSKACGVQPQAIRTWETRYKVFSPGRTEGGQRVYDEHDLKRGRLIGLLLNQGFTISKVANLELQELTELVGSDEDSHVKVRDQQNDLAIKTLFSHLEKYDIDKVVFELQYLRMNCGAKDFVFDVVLPVMQAIGNKVYKGEYSVTQEHIVSTIVRDQLGQLNLPNIGDNSRRVALATPDGNLHELSILIADIICRSNRVPTSYLGASHPANCLAEAVSALKVDTVVMGVVSSDKWDYEKSIGSYLSNLDNHLKNPITVILGGARQVDLPSFTFIRKVVFISDFESFDEALMNYSIAN